MAAKYRYVDYKKKYGNLMYFNGNKDQYIHGWYPFVEGYSKHFIRSIIKEFSVLPERCLDPFAGSGTTALELQKLGIECHSFEVSPFMHLLSRAKLDTSYQADAFLERVESIHRYLNNHMDNILEIMPPAKFKTLYDQGLTRKWNFDLEVMKGIQDIRYSIDQYANDQYKDLFMVALASILMQVSNVYKNGKCISYKKNWQTVSFNRRDVHETFLKKLKTVFIQDLRILDEYRNRGTLLSNKDLCHFGDVRASLGIIENNSIDLVITSPPYLNSRDYTDTYMVELRTLGLLDTHDTIREHRKKTLRSHVQINWETVNYKKIKPLNTTMKKIMKNKDHFWNTSIPEMILGYFEDMDTLFEQLYRTLAPEGRIYFNVANSAYYGTEIKTDKICAEIAESHGFEVREIRVARTIKPSSQQSKDIKALNESVLVLIKN